VGHRRYLIRTNSGRVSVTAFLHALGEVADLQAELPPDSGGKTDEQIALEVLLSASLPRKPRWACCRSSRGLFSKLEAARERLVPDLRVLPGMARPYTLYAAWRDPVVAHGQPRANCSTQADVRDWQSTSTSSRAFGSDRETRGA
jgi:hypothetical protein